MKIALGIVAALTVVALGLSQTPRQTKIEHPTVQSGRYQLFFGPHSRADTYLLDTQTGSVWRPLTVTGATEQGISGNPQIWVHQDRLDNSTELYEWVVMHSPHASKPNPTPSEPSPTPQSAPTSAPDSTPNPSAIPIPPQG
jgi:hypothetical protein